jgi:hypothetical protein
MQGFWVEEGDSSSKFLVFHSTFSSKIRIVLQTQLKSPLQRNKASCCSQFLCRLLFPFRHLSAIGRAAQVVRLDIIR